MTIPQQPYYYSRIMDMSTVLTSMMLTINMITGIIRIKYACIPLIVLLEILP